MRVVRVVRTALAVLAGLIPAGLRAQTPGGCAVTALTDPPRQVLRCRDGLVIEAERGAGFRLLGDPARPDAAELSSQAILIEIERRRRGGFQVLTPHAIASVRGTIYAVDVASAQTSVFVARGRVAVRGGGSDASLVLGAGEGVDVRPGAPLRATTWPRERAAGLLARFGR